MGTALSADNYKTLPALAAYIDRIGAEQLNFRKFMVKEYTDHYYTEKSFIKINDDFSIDCSNRLYEPTKAEAEAIKIELHNQKFPKAIPATNIKSLQSKLKVDLDKLFAFRELSSGAVIFVQERKEKDGKKFYVPWSLFDDGEWRMMEPDGKLPFWKPDVSVARFQREMRDQLPGKEDKSKSKIMIHEGAKAARFADWLINSPHREARDARLDHPWYGELKEYEHWGIIGGALAPHRTDYTELARMNPADVVYVCDNDFMGRAMLQDVSKHWGRSLKGVKFDQRWPHAFDLADEFPKSEAFYVGSRYIGPSLARMLSPATRATDLIPNPSGSGRPTAVLNKRFREEWLHCIRPEVFIHRDWPNQIFSGAEFNNKVAPFSDVTETNRLLMKDDAGKTAVLKYDPSREPGIYAASDSGLYINTHVPSDIKPEHGNVDPFLKFMEQLVPSEGDRRELSRWVATLIASPSTRMLYGVLLVSEAQGVGKTTLGEKILAPLLGELNVSFPGENDIIDSGFNHWVAHKRLAVVNEIYAGHSAKGYDRLKSIITDRTITVNQKYQANYQIENWVHIFACSNSMRALKLSHDDRRWFVPKITEKKQPKKFWDEFNEWLRNDGGLGKIKQWALDWGKKDSYVLSGDDAPWSSAKQEVIEEAMSPGQLLVAEVIGALKAKMEGQPFVIFDADLQDLIKDVIHNGQSSDRLEKLSTIRKIARGEDLFVADHQAQRVAEWWPHSRKARMITNDYSLSLMNTSDAKAHNSKARVKYVDLRALVRV